MVNIGSILQVQGVTGIDRAINTIQAKLAGIQTTVNVKVGADGFSRLSIQAKAAQGQIDAVSKSIRDLEKASIQSNRSLSDLEKTSGALGKSVGLATKRFAAFAIGAGSIIAVVAALKKGVSEAFDFNRELIKLSQVGGDTSDVIKGIEKEVSRLSVTLGVSSNELIKAAVTLRQAGFNAKDTKTALEALAKSSLAPNFKDIADTTEGLIAIFSQFKIEAKGLEGALGSINAVAGAFAVEAEDLIKAVKSAGGVFAQSGGQLNELLALFTSVRSTTRESADSIGTAFRTIFARVQRPETLELLRQLGIQLVRTEADARALGNVDLKGTFVGPYEAVRRLSSALKDLPEGDTRLIQISELIGGYRQISKVLPLIKEFETSQKALNIAITGQSSLTKDAAIAQDAYLVKFTKLKEQFLEFIRGLTETDGFKTFIDYLIKGASVAIKLADALKPLIPLIGAIAGVKLLQGAFPFVRQASSAFFSPTRKHEGGRIPFARGGIVPGTGNTDSVPAALMPGEFVIKKDSARKIGYDKLYKANRFADGGRVPVDDIFEKNVLRIANVDHNLKPKKGKVLVSVPPSAFGGTLRFSKDYQKSYNKLLKRNIPANTQPVNAEFKEGRLKLGNISNGLGNYIVLSVPEKQAGRFVARYKGNVLSHLPEDYRVPQSVKNRANDSFVLKEALYSEAGRSLIDKLPDNATFLGQGLQATVFDLGDGTVARLTRRNKSDNFAGRRPNIEEILPAISSERAGSFVLEKLPKVVVADDLIGSGELSKEKFKEIADSLTKKISDKGFIASDIRETNVGFTSSGNAVLFDPGFIKKKFAGGGKILKGLMGSVSSLALLLSGGGPKEVVKFFEERRRQENQATVKKALVAETGFGSSVIKKKFARGGSITDSVPALLTPGEFVFNEKAAQRIGYDNLEKANKDGVARFAKGGTVGRKRFNLGGRNTSGENAENVSFDIGSFKEVEKIADKIASELADGLNDIIKNMNLGQKEVTKEAEKFEKTIARAFKDAERTVARIDKMADKAEKFNPDKQFNKDVGISIGNAVKNSTISKGSLSDQILSSIEKDKIKEDKAVEKAFKLARRDRRRLDKMAQEAVNFKVDTNDLPLDGFGVSPNDIGVMVSKAVENSRALGSPVLEQALKSPIDPRTLNDVQKQTANGSVRVNLFDDLDKPFGLPPSIPRPPKGPDDPNNPNNPFSRLNKVNFSDQKEAISVLRTLEQQQKLIDRAGKDFAADVAKLKNDKTLTTGQRQDRITSLKRDFQDRRTDIIGQGFINTSSNVLSNPLLSKAEKEQVKNSLVVAEKFKERLKIEGEKNELAKKIKEQDDFILAEKQLQIKNEKIAKRQTTLNKVNNVALAGLFATSLFGDQLGAGPKTQGFLQGGAAGLSAGTALFGGLATVNPLIGGLAIAVTAAVSAFTLLGLTFDEEAKKLKQEEFNKQLKNTAELLEKFANRIGNININEFLSPVLKIEKTSKGEGIANSGPGILGGIINAPKNILSGRAFTPLRNQKLTDKEVTADLKAAKDEFQKQFGGQLPLIQAGLQRQLEDIANKFEQGSLDDVFKSFINSGDGATQQLIRIAAELREIPIFQVEEEFKKSLQSIRSRQQSEAQQIKGAVAVKETSLRFDILAKLLDGVSDKFERLGQVTDQLGSQFNLSFSNAKSNITGNINSFGSLNSTNFRNGVGSVLGGFGGAGNDLRDQALALDDALRVLPDAIAGAIGQNISREGRSPGEAAQAQILKELQQRGIKLPDFIRESLLANLSRFDEGQFSKEVRTKGADAVTKDLLKDASDAVISSLLALSKAFDEGINTLTNGERELQRQFQQVTAETARVAQIQADNAVRLAEIEGAKRFDPGFAVRTTATIQRDAVLARQAQFGGAVLDPEAQRKRLEDSQRRQVDIRKELARSDNSPERIALLLRELTTLESEAQRAGNALRALAGETTNTLIAIAKQRLDFIQQQREARLDAKTQLLTATGSERQDIITGATLFKRAANEGNLNNFSPEQIKQIISFSQRFGNVSGAGLGRPNESLNTILKQIINNTKRTAFGEDLSFLDLGDLISEEQKLIEEIRNLGKIQEDAQKAIVSTLGNTNKEFISQLDAQFKTFFAKQDVLIAEQLKTVAEQRQRQAVAEQGGFIAKSKTQLDSLKALGINPTGSLDEFFKGGAIFDKIQRNKDIVKEIAQTKELSETSKQEIGAGVRSLNLTDLDDTLGNRNELLFKVRSLGLRGLSNQQVEKSVDSAFEQSQFGANPNVRKEIFRQALNKNLQSEANTTNQDRLNRLFVELQKRGDESLIPILKDAKSKDINNVLAADFDALSSEARKLAKNLAIANTEFEARRDAAARLSLGPLPAVFQNGIDGLFSGTENNALFAGVATGLDSAAKTFQAAVAQIPQQIDFNGQHKVEVVINGLDILTQLQPGIQSLITQNINDAISNLQRNNPGIRS